MSTELIINATLPETRIALLENNEIQELHIERDSERGIVGNIYKGKVIRVLPGMQAAFVDIGLEKAAFLYVDDVFFPDMKIPLKSNPLPDPIVLQTIASSPTNDGRTLHRGRGRFADSRGGGGRRDQRGRRGMPMGQGRNPRDNRSRNMAMNSMHPQRGRTPAIIPIPRTPEDHARLQREYGKLMLQVGIEDDEATHGPLIVAPLQPSISEEPTKAASDPTPPADLQDQPIARAAPALEPQTEEQAEDESNEVESAAVYRPEPVIDLGAWEEEATPLPKNNLEAPTSADTRETPSETEHPRSHDSDDDDELPIRRRLESANISDLVKEGQEILVQVIKDPIGTKGARLTCHVSLPGRYLVFMPTVDHVGVSRRIEGESERRRLKEIISKIRPANTGVIVRTASGNQNDRKLKADFDFLVQSWNDLQKKYQKQRTPSVVYQDLSITLRSIRDIFTDEVDRVVVDSKREFKAIMKFVLRFMPNVKDKITLYEGDKPIFDTYGIEGELSRSFDRKVWLKSGGYIVVDQAEALVAVDVNTGRYVGKSTLEETILKTNLEAADEIAYQLRLRNCGGIIIIDFIDMEKESSREKVYKALEEALRKDRARPTILKISQLGLVEMTRKRTRDTIVRSLCEPCRYCEGRGYLKNKFTVAYDIMRDIQREGKEADTKAVTVQCHPNVADVLLEDKRDVLEDLEQQYNKKISIRANGAYHEEQYELVAHREGKNIAYSSEERKLAIRQTSSQIKPPERIPDNLPKPRNDVPAKENAGFDERRRRHHRGTRRHGRQDRGTRSGVESQGLARPARYVEGSGQNQPSGDRMRRHRGGGGGGGRGRRHPRNRGPGGGDPRNGRSFSPARQIDELSTTPVVVPIQTDPVKT